MQYILRGFNETYKDHHLKLFCDKLGLTFDKNKAEEDKELLDQLFSCFLASSADFTQSFRDMSELSLDMWTKPDKKHWGMNIISTLFYLFVILICVAGLKKLSKVKRFEKFLELYKKRLQLEQVTDEERRSRMLKTNPKYILRNWIAQKAIEAAEKGDFSVVQVLYRTLSNPYEIRADAEKLGFSGPVPDWSKDLVVSCSS